MKMSRPAQKEMWMALCFLAPSAVGFFTFYVIPFGQSLLYSFRSGLDHGKLTLANYETLIQSASFAKAAANTLRFTAIGVPLLIILSLALALFLNSRVFFRKWLRTAYVMPLVVPVASVVLVWQIFFDWNGALNVLLERAGISRIDWMKSDWAMASIILIYIWKNIGYNVVLFLAALQNIPDQYYEIANLEGAGIFRKFGITLIYLLPGMFLVSLMSILNSFKVFRETYLVAGDYPHDSIYMLQHYINNMFLSLEIEKLSAAATLLALCILLVVFILYRVERSFHSFME
ncbi:sugar ABC transporter permease [Paenibacillus oralis]|uniref:Sugar ABC transporter permease n=1 Tax=Paenibacillus oralis TaxID=2490856 RepID=A0A3P3UA11_9BACL|nr:sugar ABC transporter permease [Paenibacillus oralis]RRJ67191.1 sugar ABC transporter permease [Paenibacillus oralis]